MRPRSVPVTMASAAMVVHVRLSATPVRMGTVNRLAAVPASQDGRVPAVRPATTPNHAAAPTLSASQVAPAVQAASATRAILAIRKSCASPSVFRLVRTASAQSLAPAPVSPGGLARLARSALWVSRGAKPTPAVSAEAPAPSSACATLGLPPSGGASVRHSASAAACRAIAQLLAHASAMPGGKTAFSRTAASASPRPLQAPTSCRPNRVQNLPAARHRKTSRRPRRRHASVFLAIRATGTLQRKGPGMAPAALLSASRSVHHMASARRLISAPVTRAGGVPRVMDALQVTSATLPPSA